MPLNMTKIAYSAESVAGLRDWLENHADTGEALMTTRYLPKRHEEMIGGSLYWIFEHALIGRSPILRFTQRDDGRWHIHLAPTLIPVQTRPRRAHQGWRYLAEEDAPADLAEGETQDDAMPARLVGELAKLGLV
jgi:hypothetical protein